MVLCKCFFLNYTYFTLPSRGLGLVGLALYLVDWPTIVLQCFDTVGWVIWPVKIVPNMNYNVFSAMKSYSTTTGCTLWAVRCSWHSAPSDNQSSQVCCRQHVSTTLYRPSVAGFKGIQVDRDLNELCRQDVYKYPGWATCIWIHICSIRRHVSINICVFGYKLLVRDTCFRATCALV